MNIRDFLISKPIETLKEQRMFRDRMFRGFLLIAGILTLVILVVLLLRVRPKEFVVPLEFSSLSGFDKLGSWYKVYSYGVFSVLVTTMNVTLAAMSFEKSRIGSFLLVLGTIIINTFALVVVLTLTAQLDA